LLGCAFRKTAHFARRNGQTGGGYAPRAERSQAGGSDDGAGRSRLAL